jgi:3-dehydroquinate synthase
LAFETSARLGLCAQEAPSRVRAHLKAMGMKTDMSDIDAALPEPAALFALMGQDKKVIAGQLNFIMARDIGRAFVTSDVSEEVVLSVLEDSMGPRSI